MMVSGKTAADLGEFFRQRWKLVNSENLDAGLNRDSPDIWPTAVAPDILNGKVGIARTRAAYEELEAVHEVEHADLGEAVEIERCAELLAQRHQR